MSHAPDSHPIPVGASSTPDTKQQTVNGFNRLLRLKPYQSSWVQARGLDAPTAPIR
jgi:hypothetical protein